MGDCQRVSSRWGQLFTKSSSRHCRQCTAVPEPLRLKASKNATPLEEIHRCVLHLQSSRLTLCCSTCLSLAFSRDGPSATTVDDHRQGMGATLSPMHPESSRSNACKDYIANTSFHSIPRSDLTCSQSRWLIDFGLIAISK